MSKPAIALVFVLVFGVAIFGFYIYRSRELSPGEQDASATLTPLPSQTPVPTPSSNPLGGVRNNPFEAVKFNPFD